MSGPLFILPGTLAGYARGLREPGAVEFVANQIAADSRSQPKRCSVPSVRLLQLLDHLAIYRPRPESVPNEVMVALAALLGIEKYLQRKIALASPESDHEIAARLGKSEKTIGRWRTNGIASKFSELSALQIADVSRGFRPRGAHEALYDLAVAEAASGTFFSGELLWALAEALGVADRRTGMTQSAIEVLSNGLRRPDKFIAAAIAEGQAELEGKQPSINAAANSANAARKSVREDWRTNPAYALNKMAPSAFAKFNAPSSERLPNPRAEKWRLRREGK